MGIFVTKTKGANKCYIVKYLYKTKQRRRAMYINDRDQINYHGFLKASRRMQKATINQVAEGICSYSEVSRVEIGDRLPEKLMRDRITSRLGISGEEYEEYLRPEEYRQWECRMRILDGINNGNIQAVEKEIEEYDSIMERNPVQEQFLETMRYMYMQMKGASTETLALLLQLAILHTIPNINAAFEGAQLLADQELNLILEYTNLRECEGENEFEWRLSEYKKILKYVDESHMDTISKSKIYPRTTYYVCKWILKENPSFENLYYALDLCNISVEILRDASRLYYFVELMECRQEIIQHLMTDSPLTEEKSRSLLEVKAKDLEWETLFKNLYTEYNVPIYMQNFTYLYAETESNSAVEVIRIRRRMIKLSRAKVGKNICTEKTVERFEKYENSPSIVVIRDIFEKIGLCAEYRRARVITDNAKVLALSNQLIRLLNNGEMENSKKCLDKLTEKLHMDIVFNSQEIKKNKNLIAARTGEIEGHKLYKSALEALEYTIPFSAVVRREERYLTRSELECIYDLAFHVNGEVSQDCYTIIEKMCKEAMGKEIEPIRICVYETLMSGLCSRLGDEGRYEESIELSQWLLKECLKNRRMVVLVDNLYNILWNYEKYSQEKNDSHEYLVIKRYLTNCVMLGEINRSINWIEFLKPKYEMMSEAINE